MSFTDLICCLIVTFLGTAGMSLAIYSSNRKPFPYKIIPNIFFGFCVGLTFSGVYPITKVVMELGR